MRHNKVAKFAFTLAIAFVASTASAQVAGIVAAGEGRCQKRDRVLVDTNMGFTLAQQYSGSYDRDDKVVGDLNSYGFKDVLVNGHAGRLWIDDYMASRDKAERWCFGEE